VPNKHATEGEMVSDFGRLFDEAFARLDQQRGSHNLVSLVKLRQEVPVERMTFDTELHRLRRAGRYTLTTSEARHGISHEEQEAGIVEDGTLLLFVSRKPANGLEPDCVR
jgi:hypothetical protein